ncbi:MAG: hypothetical protein HY561_05315 [Gemmatimonadetes bacterium]|nr:hypothetical protein [Gemmatimonadota bacterium]
MRFPARTSPLVPRRAWTARLLFVLVAASACAREDEGPLSPEAVAGVFELTERDGLSLPYVAADNSLYTERLLSGRLRLDASGRYQDVKLHEWTSAGDVLVDSMLDRGTYRVSQRHGPDRIEFRSELDRGSFVGTLDGQSLTYAYRISYWDPYAREERVRLEVYSWRRK